MANHSIMIGDKRLNRTVASQKLTQDIEFLTERIEQLNSQRSPNPKIIKVYQDMLNTRHSVLEWINSLAPVTNVTPARNLLPDAKAKKERPAL